MYPAALPREKSPEKLFTSGSGQTAVFSNLPPTSRSDDEKRNVQPRSTFCRSWSTPAGSKAKHPYPLPWCFQAFSISISREKQEAGVSLSLETINHPQISVRACKLNGVQHLGDNGAVNSSDVRVCRETDFASSMRQSLRVLFLKVWQNRSLSLTLTERSPGSFPSPPGAQNWVLHSCHVRMSGRWSWCL